MYKWNIKYVLKNGEYLYGTYYGNEKDTAGVCKVLLSGDLNTFNACKTTDEKGTVCVRNGDITALIVSL